MNDPGIRTPSGYLAYGPDGGGPTTERLRRADPERESISGGTWFNPAAVPRILPATLDDIMRRQGPRIYDAMDLDPYCRGAKDTLKYSIVAGGMDLAPAEEPKAGSKTLTPDEELAAELVDFCWRSIERVPDFEDQAFDLLECCREGAKLAKVTVELAADGPDAGQVVLRSFRVKPNELWRFVVDDFMDVVGIAARDPAGDGGWVPYRPEPFVWMSWEPRDGDPRGRSVYHPANYAWNLKLINWPEYRKYLFQFASGKVMATAPPINQAVYAADPVTGRDLTSAPMVSTRQRMVQDLANTQNGSVYVGPPGSTANVIFPTGNGEAFTKAVDLLNREITQAIHGSTRATMEAEHGSKADNQGGQDILGLKVERGRKALAAAIRRCFRMLVAANHGPDVASRLTPLVTYGQADHQDRAALWGAASGLMTSGYLGESQVAELDAMIGLPIRDAEADAEAAEEREAKAMEAQQAIAGVAPGEEGAEEEEEEEEEPAQFARGGAMRRMVGKSKAAVARGAVAKGQCGPGGGAPCHVDKEGGGPMPDGYAVRRDRQGGGYDLLHVEKGSAPFLVDTFASRAGAVRGAAKDVAVGVANRLDRVVLVDPDRARKAVTLKAVLGRLDPDRAAKVRSDPATMDDRALGRLEAVVVRKVGRARDLGTLADVRQLIARHGAADFAAAPSEPWGTEDLIAARGLIDANLPSLAALERWSKGTETLANRLAVLGYLADDAKATLRAEGEALAAKLAAMAPPATDAEADAALAAVEAEIEALEAVEEEESAGLGPEAWFLIAAFLEGMRVRLRRAHMAGSMVLVGPIDMTAAEGEALERANAEQVRYLAGFAMALASGKQPPSRIGQRAGQYGDSVWTVAMAVQQADAIKRGMTEARSVLGASERSCTGPPVDGKPSCVAEAGKKWQSIGVVSLPGRRKCGGACKCHLEYRAGKGVTP